MYNKNTENLTRKPMTFEELVPLFNKFQKHKASTQIRKVDRAKTSLTYKEQLNKFAKLGGYIISDKAIFTYDNDLGMGVLITQTQKIYNATLSDFYKLIRG